MYEQEVLAPRFDVHELAAAAPKGSVDLTGEEPIPQVVEVFQQRGLEVEY